MHKPRRVEIDRIPSRSVRGRHASGLPREVVRGLVRARNEPFGFRKGGTAPQSFTCAWYMRSAELGTAWETCVM